MTSPATTPPTPRRLCPPCGSRVSAEATRCVVCGSELHPGPARRRRAGRSTGQIVLPLPLAVGILVGVVALAAGLVLVVSRMGGGGRGEPSPTASLTPTVSNTPEPTSTPSPEPTWTPLPPIEITLGPNLYCVDLAAIFDVSLQSILAANPGMRCELLVQGQRILIPQPTPTGTPLPTNTLSPEEATRAACETITYTVQDSDTLSGIATNYNIDMQAIMAWNNMSGPTVFSGQVLILPLCARNPTPGPSPTPTPPPPYPAPNLLLPQDGAAFTLANDSVTLQWASVGQLRENEYYQVIVEDVTEGTGTRRIVDYVRDTKYIVPASMRPAEAVPHVLRWWVTTVRQTGTNAAGNPIYTSAGAVSIRRDFTWSGAAIGPTPTP